MHRTKIQSRTRITMRTGSPDTFATQALDKKKLQTMRLNPQTDLRAWSRGLQPSNFTVLTYKTGDGSIRRSISVDVLHTSNSHITCDPLSVSERKFHTSAANFLKKSFCGVPRIAKPSQHQRNDVWSTAPLVRSRSKNSNVQRSRLSMADSVHQEFSDTINVVHDDENPSRSLNYSSRRGDSLIVTPACQSGLISNQLHSCCKRGYKEEIPKRVKKIKETFQALIRYRGREQDSPEQSRSLSSHEMAQIIVANDERWAKFQRSLRKRDESGVLCFTTASLNVHLPNKLLENIKNFEPDNLPQNSHCDDLKHENADDCRKNMHSARSILGVKPIRRSRSIELVRTSERSSKIVAPRGRRLSLFR